MRWLKRVFGRLTSSTQHAGPVSPEPMNPPSSKCIVPDTLPRQSYQPVQTLQKRKHDPVGQISLAVRPGSVRALALLLEQLTRDGLKNQAPASQPHQVVSRQRKQG